MRFHSAILTTLAWSCLIVAVAVVALPSAAQPGAEGAEPTLEMPQVALEGLKAGPQVMEGAAAPEGPEPAVETPEGAERAPMLAGEASITPSLLPNPCYQFDDPSTGCYYKWRPSDFCCISPDPRCPSICY